MSSSTLSSWQTALANCITDPKELFELLELNPDLLEEAKTASRDFPLRVPRGFVARMRKGDPEDPLLRQVLPLGIELMDVPGYEKDPLAEAKANPVPGLLHKYHDRVLLTVTGACGIHCRYCFRRHFPYADNNPGTAGWEQALIYIGKNPTIAEVILSGGDPLVANDQTLHALIEKLAAIPHVTRLRVHSRLPIVLPERMTPELVAALTATRLQPVLVVHANHPQEINKEICDAMRPAREAGVMLLNQSVLLKGINDNAGTLIALSQALFAAGILPYYLHVLDKVAGAAHFDLPLEVAQTLHAEIASRLSGYLVPKLVAEKPGFPAKLLVNSDLFYTT